MPEDVLKMAQDVMGGRWYRCPNGHPFYVDLCGRPTQINKCAECGSEIGGTDHNLLSGNQDIGNVGEELYQKTVLADQSEPNYGVRSVDDEEKDQFYSVRTLNPTSHRAIQWILHSAMVVGHAAAGAAWDSAAAPVVNSSYADTTVAGGLGAYATLHWHSNWRTLKKLTDRNADDVAVLLHLVLLSCGPSTEVEDNPPAAALQEAAAATAAPPPADGGGGGGGTAATKNYAVLSSTSLRNEFEKMMDLAHISRILNGQPQELSATLDVATARFTKSEEDGDEGGVFQV